MTGVRCRTSSPQTDYGYSRFVAVDSPLLVLICVGGETAGTGCGFQAGAISRQLNSYVYPSEQTLSKRKLEPNIAFVPPFFLLILSPGTAVDVDRSPGNGSRYQGTDHTSCWLGLPTTVERGGQTCRMTVGCLEDRHARSEGNRWVWVFSPIANAKTLGRCLACVARGF
jgi:hypothetical protein